VDLLRHHEHEACFTEHVDQEALEVRAGEVDADHRVQNAQGL
jgi:hypothetical protein